MRLEEIAQLESSDIAEVNGIWYFDINSTGEKHLKNQTASRLVPIHSKIKAQLLQYKNTQEGRLFPDLTPANGKLSHNFSKWFTRHRQSCGVTAPGKTFHSFRHTVATHFKQALIVETMAAAILGHTVEGQSYGRYGKAYKLEQLQEVIEKIGYAGNIPM
jgi:integrase